MLKKKIANIIWLFHNWKIFEWISGIFIIELIMGILAVVFYSTETNSNDPINNWLIHHYFHCLLFVNAIVASVILGASVIFCIWMLFNWLKDKWDDLIFWAEMNKEDESDAKK
jgi:UDP-N-acetylmuramyl pentapeptide phosphotransferase/UDP-N-acetylglucosamine-1-phosphate transferase